LSLFQSKQIIIGYTFSPEIRDINSGKIFIKMRDLSYVKTVRFQREIIGRSFT